MDLAQGLDPVGGSNFAWVRGEVSAERTAAVFMRRLGTGKLIGLIFGCLVVAVMLFMMFAVLGGVFSWEQ